MLPGVVKFASLAAENLEPMDLSGFSDPFCNFVKTGAFAAQVRAPVPSASLLARRRLACSLVLGNAFTCA
eukprot:SAG22_NODE_276_length_13167_cov_8.415825_5_plen_70_part_00